MKLLLFILTALVSAERAEPPDLSFIEGTWRGHLGDAVIEETWSVADAGHRIGMFRMLEAGELVFSELMTIEPEAESLVMRLRHFGPGLTAKEGPDEALVLDLVDSGANRAVFRQRRESTRIIYERVEDRLTITLEKRREGRWERTSFVFERR